MEEIIPFLIFVFWIVRSIFTQKRKAEEQRKKAGKTSPEKPFNSDYEEPKPKRRPPIIFEPEEPEIDILEEIFGKKVESKPKPPPSVIQPVAQKKSIRDIELQEKRIALQMKQEYEKEKVDFRKETAKSFEYKQVHKKRKRKLTHSKSMVTNFNLKKAVLYSEILKRPYE